MNINFSHANGASNWLHSLKENIYENIANGYPSERTENPLCRTQSGFSIERDMETRVETIYSGTRWTYLSGFPKGMFCALLSIAARVTGVIEPVVKGLSNVFAAPFSKNFNAKTGLKMLAVDLPKSIFKFIFLTPVEVIADGLISPFAVMLDKSYAEARSEFESSMKTDDYLNSSVRERKFEFDESSEGFDFPSNRHQEETLIFED